MQLSLSSNGLSASLSTTFLMEIQPLDSFRYIDYNQNSSTIVPFYSDMHDSQGKENGDDPTRKQNTALLFKVFTTTGQAHYYQTVINWARVETFKLSKMVHRHLLDEN